MSFWVQMTVDTFRDPKRTAEKIIQWQITKTELYLAMIAFSAVNAFLAGLSSIISPLSVDPAALESMPILALMKMPLILFVLIVTGLIISIHGFFWAGSVMGGQGQLKDMLVLFTWLQGLRAVAQAAVFLLSLAIPTLGSLLAVVVVIVAFWILLHFISVALNFNSLLRSFTVLVVVSTAFFLSLMMLVTITGVAMGGLIDV